MVADEQARIWEPFHRVAGIEVAGEVSRVSAQSLGLGLYICRTIIEQHHSQVGGRRAPGRGSTFWFKLPVLPAIRQARIGPAPAALAAA
jgi:signal transduction histidine kinase